MLSSNHIIMLSGNYRAGSLHIRTAPLATAPSIYAERTSGPTFLYQVMHSEGYLNSVIASPKIKTDSTAIYSLLLGNY